VAPPSSKRPGGRSKIEQYGLAAGIVITALGGSAVLDVLKSCSSQKPATAEQQNVTNDRLARLEAKFDDREARDKAERERDVRRWNTIAGHNCRLNGSKPTPFARGVDCDAVIWDPPPLGATVPWVAREEWIAPKP
jgi:hypothetical protein